jgi:NADPH:quinone reductase-like Zn-dependent oxidoreductase
VRAAFIHRQNSAPVVGEFPDPTPTGGKLLVEVKVGAIGPTDLAKAAGTWRPYPGPHIVNGEGAGRLADGRRVYFGHSATPYGALAERTLVPEAWVWPISDSIDDEQAAAIGTAGTGALASLEAARIEPGDRVLILGATGVVGQMGLQIARAMGAGVVAAAGRDAAVLDRLRKRGLADVTAQIGQGDDLAALKAIADGGWNVVLDVIYGRPAEAALKTTAWGARMVTMGKFAGSSVTLDAGDLGGRTLSGVGTNSLTLAERRAHYQRLADLVAAGKLKVEVLRHTLDQAPQAWAALGGSPHAKILVAP